MTKAFLLACMFAVGAAGPVLAANADHPYANCDRKVDNCGPTGNEATDRLNAQQLGGSGAAPVQDQATPMPGQPMPMQPMSGQPMPMRQ